MRSRQNEDKWLRRKHRDLRSHSWKPRFAISSGQSEVFKGDVWQPNRHVTFPLPFLFSLVENPSTRVQSDYDTVRVTSDTVDVNVTLLECQACCHPGRCESILVVRWALAGSCCSLWCRKSGLRPYKACLGCQFRKEWKTTVDRESPGEIPEPAPWCLSQHRKLTVCPSICVVEIWSRSTTVKVYKKVDLRLSFDILREHYRNKNPEGNVYVWRCSPWHFRNLSGHAQIGQTFNEIFSAKMVA